MNDFILKLIKDADLDIHKFWNDDGSNRLEQFAELIVRECSKIIVNGGYLNPAFGEKRPASPPEIAMMIKDYFGVEE